jgi:hypothetical protein
MVSCPKELRKDGEAFHLYSTGSIPSHCPKKLEHAVAAGCVNIDKKEDREEEGIQRR